MKHSSPLSLLLTAALILNQGSFAFANYNDEEKISGNAGGSSGSGMATQAGVGVLSYLVSRAVQKKNAGKAGNEPAAMACPRP